MALLAAATRARLNDANLQPRRNVAGFFTVNVTLRPLTTVNHDQIRQALRLAFGEPHFLKGGGAGANAGQLFVNQGASIESMKRGVLPATFISPTELNTRPNLAANPSNFLRNPFGRDSNANWVVVGGGSVVRQTGQSLLGPTTLRITTAGVANDGAYEQNATRLTVGATQTYRAWGVVAPFAGANIRPYMSEYQSDGTTLVGKTNIAAQLAASASPQVWSLTRASIPAGRVLRVGYEKPTAVTESFDVGGTGCAPSALGGELASTQPPATTAGAPVIHLPLTFVGVEFEAVRLYDALDLIFGVVASDKDEMGNGQYEFTIA